ncbi:MAG: phosphate signaling complex protein PhoU [Candidatus Bathyarchaeia archaeon]
MSRLLDSGLEELATKVYRMGELAEKTVNIAVSGFLVGKDTTREIRGLSEMLSAMSVEIEGKAFELIVKHQPVATDLRIINSYIKIAYDFERYGRYSWDIAITQKRFNEIETPAHPLKPITHLAKAVIRMVAKSIKAVKDHNAEIAKSLAKDEEEVDKRLFNYIEQLTTATVQTKSVLCDLLIAHFLERIADHTAYVGEAVVYITSGEKISLR